MLRLNKYFRFDGTIVLVCMALILSVYFNKIIVFVSVLSICCIIIIHDQFSMRKRTKNTYIDVTNLLDIESKKARKKAEVDIIYVNVKEE